MNDCLKKKINDVFFIDRSEKIKLFKIIFIFWLLTDTLLDLRFYEYFWGENAISRLEFKGESWWNYFSAIIEHPSLINFAWVFICGQFISGISVLLTKGIVRKIFEILLLFFTLNLYEVSFLSLDGGNNLAKLILIYIAVFDWESTEDWFQNLSGNLFLIMAQFQVCTMYLTAGLSKVIGPLWRKGIALYYILNVPQYKLPVVSEALIQNEVLITLGTYFTIIFQLFFPVMIYKKSTKNIWIILGVFIHLNICIIMGLVHFGLIMIISYILFLNNNDIFKLKNGIQNIYGKINRRVLSK